MAAFLGIASDAFVAAVCQLDPGKPAFLPLGDDPACDVVIEIGVNAAASRGAICSSHRENSATSAGSLSPSLNLSRNSIRALALRTLCGATAEGVGRNPVRPQGEDLPPPPFIQYLDLADTRTFGLESDYDGRRPSLQIRPCDLFRIENGILRLTAGGASTEDIAHQVCRDVENQLPGLFCAVWRTDAAGVPKLLAAPSFSSQFSGATEGELSTPDLDLTMVGFERDERNLVADIVPIIKELPSDPPALPFEARAFWATRVTGENGEIVGILVPYSLEPRAPTNSEVASITTIRELCEIAFRRHKPGEHVREADIDALTGLPSPAAFERALRRLRCDVAGAWALFVVDLDNLETVNDIFGDKAGDDLIRIAGTRIAQVMAPDATFRLGGDEFVIIVEQPGVLRDPAGAAQRIFDSLDLSALCDGQAVIPNSTIGGAVLDVTVTDVASVHQNADFALYHAKETGRSGFVRYWSGIGSRMIRWRTVVRDVAAAMREQRIEAHY